MNRIELNSKVAEKRVLAEITGFRDIMFDRYPGDNKTELEAWQKLYLSPVDGKTIVLPAGNILSALTAQNTDSWTKSIMDARKYKKTCHAFAQSISIKEQYIPFLRDAEPIHFGSFDDEGIDSESLVYVRNDVARLDKGIPNPKTRPVLPCPWQLKFEVQIIPSGEFNEQELVNILSKGLNQIGLGTFRRVFGRAELTAWDTIEE